MNDEKRAGILFWFFLLLAIAAVVDMVATVAHAGGTDIDLTNQPYTQQHVNQEVGDSLVDVSGDKNRAYALGMASGTIADCMAHWGIAIVSLPARNKFCERIDFTQWAENPSRHTPQSVTIRCSTRIAKEIFGDRKACETAFVTAEPPDQHTQEILLLSEQLQATNARLDAQDTVIAALRAEKEKAMARLQRAEKTAQRAATAPQTVIQREEFLDDDKKARLAALKGDK